MRIGVAALGNLAEDTGGRNYIEHFFRHLPKVGSAHTFVLFISQGQRLKLHEQVLAAAEVIEINAGDSSLQKVFGEQVLLRKYIREHAIDIMYFPGNFATYMCPVPYVLNIRGMAHYYGSKYGVGLTRRVIRQAIMPSSARFATMIITPSEDIRTDVIRFLGVAREKTIVIPHGVDMSLFSPLYAEDPRGNVILERFGLQPRKYFLYVSALWRYKNQDKLIAAFEMLKAQMPSELKLVLAGKGTGVESEYLRELEELRRRSDVADDVIMTGQLLQSDLKYLYANASAFVFPSSYESFGNPIFEAWASEIPVATSNVHSFPEIVADAGLLFNPSDIGEIASAMKRLVSDPELRARLIQRGSDRVREFSWEKCIRRTLSVLEGVRQPR